MLRSPALSFLAPLVLSAGALHAQCELQKFHPEVDEFLFHVWDVDGDLAILSTRSQFALYERTPFGWVPGQELLPADALPWAAGAALDGDRLVTARYSASETIVYVYERPDPGQPFLETAQLVPSLAPDVSGYASLALEGDVLVVGVPETAIVSQAGQVHVFEHAAGAWSETFHTEGVAGFSGGSALGWDVAVDGGVVFAGALGFEGPFGSGIQGAGIRVYSKSGSAWSEDQLLPEIAYSISAEGGRLATLSHDGTARIHALIAGTWTETASFPTPSTTRIALEGTTLVVGDPKSAQSGFSSAGAVHVYEDVAGTWSLKGTLFAHDAKSKADLGQSLALAGDTLLVGAPGDADAGSAGTLAKGAAYAWSLAGLDCPSLTADRYGIPSASGGTQTLSLAPGAAFAGDLYVIAGSLSGVWPGTPFAAQTIPLNADAYLVHTLFYGGSPPLVGAIGFLDGTGAATAQVVLPADPMLAGLKAHHAFGVADAGLQLVHVSNPVPLAVP